MVDGSDGEVIPRSPGLALILFAPLPTIGVVSNALGSTFNAAWLATAGLMTWVACKFGLFGLPAIWHRKVDGGDWGYSPMAANGRARAILEGVAAGVAMSTIVLLSHSLASSSIDDAVMGARLRSMGLDSMTMVVFALLFWIFVNSIAEEYAYRWFATRQALSLTGRTDAAIAISATIFASHHAIGVVLVAGWTLGAVAAVGVWMGGAVFSWLTLRHGSIWPAWIAHAIVDVAVFGIIATIALG